MSIIKSFPNLNPNHSLERLKDNLFALHKLEEYSKLEYPQKIQGKVSIACSVDVLKYLWNNLISNGTEVYLTYNDIRIAIVDTDEEGVIHLLQS